MTSREFEAMLIVSLGLLERLTGIDRRKLRRLFAADGVPLRKSGNRHVVHRNALRRVMPDFYRGLLDRLDLAERSVTGTNWP